MSRSANVGACAVAAALVVAVSLSAQSPSLESQADFSALLTAAQNAFRDLEWDRATAQYQTILDSARAKGQALWEGRGILGLAKVANERTQYAEGRRQSSEALAIFERLNSIKDIGDASRTLGISVVSMGEDVLATTHFERAIAAYREAGEARDLADARFRLARVAIGNPQVRLEIYAELQRDAQAFGDRGFEGQILHSWGDALYTLAQYELAIEKLDAAAACYEETKRLGDLGTVYNSLGRGERTLEIDASLAVVADSLVGDGHGVEALNIEARRSGRLMNLERLELKLQRRDGLPVRAIQAAEAVVHRS